MKLTAKICSTYFHSKFPQGKKDSKFYSVKIITEQIMAVIDWHTRKLQTLIFLLWDIFYSTPGLKIALIPRSPKLKDEQILFIKDEIIKNVFCVFLYIFVVLFLIFIVYILEFLLFSLLCIVCSLLPKLCNFNDYLLSHLNNL